MHSQFPRSNCQRYVHFLALFKTRPCTSIRAIRPDLQKNLRFFEDFPSSIINSAVEGTLAILTKNVANSFAAKRIRCNGIIQKAWMDTPGDDAEKVSWLGEDSLAKTGVAQPIGQLVRPDQLTGLVAHLPCPKSGVVTGALVACGQNVSGTYRNKLENDGQTSKPICLGPPTRNPTISSPGPISFSFSEALQVPVKKSQSITRYQLMHLCAVDRRIVDAVLREFCFPFLVAFIQEYLMPDRTRNNP